MKRSDWSTMSTPDINGQLEELRKELAVYNERSTQSENDPGAAKMIRVINSEINYGVAELKNR